MVATFAPPTLRAAVLSPCAYCNAHELASLQRGQDTAAWEYELEVPCKCARCDLPWTWRQTFERSLIALLAFYFVQQWIISVEWLLVRTSPFCYIPTSPLHTYYFVTAYLFRRWLINRGVRTKRVKMRFTMDCVSLIERVVGAASVSEKGSKLRPYGSFISYLTTLEADAEYKSALQCWAPLAIGGFIEHTPGVQRRPLPGQLSPSTDPAEVQDAVEGNPDLNGSGEMPGTSVPRDSYAEDAVRQKHKDCMSERKVSAPEPRILAKQIGPDLRAAECFESTEDNIAAAIDNRFQAPPFTASIAMKKKINATVDMMIKEIFSVEAIKAWRVGWIDKHGNYVPQCFEEMHSKKWSEDRFARAVDNALADVESRIEQEFQNKTNEVQDAGKKLPRPRNIIQCGDEAQVKMLLPVKCFEDLLFAHYKDASIKKGTKHEAMMRMTKHLTQKRRVTCIEGDGSSWDACCNSQIRDLTENRIIRHIIEVLGFDAEVPTSWMIETLNDMKSPKIRGKAKVVDHVLAKIRVKVDAIRQSGHRGTSAFNYLINLVCWLCVLADNPEEMIEKRVLPMKNGEKRKMLQEKYISAYDGMEYAVRYAFEGDDSALTTTEDIKAEGRAKHILDAWTSLGFKMKLVYADKKLTFTGFDFLMGNNGPTSTFFPEIKRNIASSSWTTSPEVRQFPDRLHRVASAAFLARAENFKDCEPFAHYFAALGLAHANKCGFLEDTEIKEIEAEQLGIVPGEIKERLNCIFSETHPLTKQERSLLREVIGDVPEEKWIGLQNLHLDDPFDTARIKHVLPKEAWFEARSPKTRKRGADQLLENCR